MLLYKFVSTDYNLAIRRIDGGAKFFIKFHDQYNTPEREISPTLFMLYRDEFNKPLINQNNERRRHIEADTLESRERELANQSAADENNRVTKYAIEAALKMCTPTQQRRFNLYHVYGYTLEEIGEMEGCHFSSVSESVNAVSKKLKSFAF